MSSETGAGHTHHTRFRIPRTMWEAFGRVCERLGVTRTERLLSFIRADLAEHGDGQDHAALEAADRELAERRARRGGRPPKTPKEESE